MEKQWYLESFRTDGERIEFVITQLPYRIGRNKGNDLIIANLGLSRAHAALTRDISGKLRLTDLNSTNGTFVNRRRVDGYSLMDESDILHFANAEFKLCARLVEQQQDIPFDERLTVFMPENMTRIERFIPKEAEIDELIMGYGISGAVQPIVDAHTRQTFAYELLGRANHPSLPSTPVELFSLAESMGRELDLSNAFRDYQINQVVPHYASEILFINSHPKETFDAGFVASLTKFRHTWPEQSIVIEIHESAITEISQLKQFASQLDDLNIDLAYDDFGAGRARLLELAEVPVDFVKFDISLVNRLHRATSRKRQLVKDLVHMVLSSGSVPLAEGIECEEEAQACIDTGFHLIQGYLTGRPVIVSDPLCP